MITECLDPALAGLLLPGDSETELVAACEEMVECGMWGSLARLLDRTRPTFSRWARYRRLIPEATTEEGKAQCPTSFSTKTMES